MQDVSLSAPKPPVRAAFTAPPRKKISGLPLSLESVAEEEVTVTHDSSSKENSNNAANTNNKTSVTSMSRLKSALNPFASRTQNAAKYEISDELRREFAKARAEQQKLVQQALQLKKQRERQESQESLEQVQQPQNPMDGLADISDPRFASFFTDERVEELVQYAIYLGVDLENQPDLVHLIRDLYYAPLPEGWTAHKTTAESTYGANFTYYSGPGGGSSWQHPREDYHVNVLAARVERILPGSRIWFARRVSNERHTQRQRFAWSVRELPEKRPLVRAGEKSSFDPNTATLDCVVHGKNETAFPILHPAVLVSFANYFQIRDFPDSLMWAVPWLKVASVCPVPSSWSFRFDSVQSDAVYIENDAFSAGKSSFSRRHPMDGFFLGLLKRLRRRHAKWAFGMDKFVRDKVVLNYYLVYSSEGT